MSTQPPIPSPARSTRQAAWTPLVFLAIAAASVVAAGVGGYVAQSQRPVEPTVEARPAQPAPATAPIEAPHVPSAGAVATAPTSAPAAVEPPIGALVETAEPVEPRAGRAPRVAPPSREPVERRRSEPRRVEAESQAPPRVAAAAPALPPVAAVPPAPSRTAEPAPAMEMPVPEAPVVAEAAPRAAPAPVAQAQSAQVSIAETFEIPADSVIGLEIEHSVSSETARPEDRVDARVARDVMVDGIVVIPAGSRVRGEVTRVESGGRFKERGRIEIRFHTLVLGDGDTQTIATDTLFREGDNVGRRAGARIGATAAGGAIIGAIFGGEKGAAIGAAAGAGAGTAVTAAQKPSEARFRAGSVVTVRLTEPLSITVQQ